MTSVLDELKKINEAREALQAKVTKETEELLAKQAKLLAEAKVEAKKRIQAVIDEANSLGFNFWIGEGTKGGSAPKAKGTRGSMAAGKVCPVCNFATNPPHDGRSHRSQATKAPFTAGELKERGLTKLD